MRLNKNTIFYVVVVLLIFVLSSCMTQNVEKEKSGNILTAERDFYAVEIEFENKVEVVDSFSDVVYIQKDNIVSIASSEIIKKGEKLISVKNDEYSIKNIQYIESLETKSTDSVIESLPINSIRKINFDLSTELDIPSDTVAVELEIVKDDYIIFTENSGLNIVKNMENSYLIAMTYDELINNGFNIKLYANTPGLKSVEISSINYSKGDKLEPIALEAPIKKELYFFDFLPADFNRDGFVNLSDLYLFRNNYREDVIDSNTFYDIAPGDRGYMFNGVSVKSIGDSVIGLYDFLQFVRSYGLNLGRPTNIDLPDDYSLLPIDYEPPVDDFVYYKMEIFTINDFVNPQDFLKVELFKRETTNKVGEFILPKVEQTKYPEVTKYSGWLKVPESIANPQDYWDELTVRFIRKDGTKSVFPGLYNGYEVIRVYPLNHYGVERNGYNYDNRKKFAYVVKFWEDQLPEKINLSKTIDNSEALWVEELRIRDSIFPNVAGSGSNYIIGEQIVPIENSQIDFYSYSRELTDKNYTDIPYMIKDTWGLYLEGNFVRRISSIKIDDLYNVSEVKLNPMPIFKVKVEISDTATFTGTDVQEMKLYSGLYDFDYFKDPDLYYKFKSYVNEENEFFIGDSSYYFGYDFDKNNEIDTYFRYFSNVQNITHYLRVEKSYAYVSDTNFASINHYDSSLETYHLSLYEDRFDDHVLVYRTEDKYIKMQVLEQTTVDATFVNEVMNWGDSQ